MATILEKLRCKNIIDLALITPKGYENQILSQNLQESPLVVEVKIINYKLINRKVAHILAYMPMFQQDVEMVIFNPKHYHSSQFYHNNNLIISGKPDYTDGYLKIIQPRVLKDSGEIVPILPTIAGVSRKKILSFFQESLTTEALVKQSIPLHHAQEIEKIYKPTPIFLNVYKKLNTFSPKSLKALKFLEIYRFLLAIKINKKEYKSPKIKLNNPQKFILNLPFSLTQDQHQTIIDIYTDLQGNNATKRVIMGDVGCGKSLVIFASAFMVFPQRSLLMAPTSLLAIQLYEEAIKFLPKNMKIVLVKGGESIQDTEIQNAHFIIGTHALLWHNIRNVVLIMIDEQHRFGVGHRNFFISSQILDEEPSTISLFEEIEKIQKKSRPHTLQFSATPIPRTLAMIESSFVDLSLIKQRPFERIVHTKVISRKDFPDLLSHIQQEISQNRQVAIIYPLVNSSETSLYRSLSDVESFWKKHFESVYITHGKDKDKENKLLEFREKGHILLSTTIIEVGISLPRLSTIVISGAERFGLATLHQLRGRVSRNGLAGYCFLFTHKEKSERLESFAACQDGFEVAELDLRLRKSGDILGGERQSGEEFRFFSLSDDIEILQEAKETIENIQKL
ncbi:ATP-dependent DNA helicase RecG [Helicobacter monodelphidis]|uniref:ATP-dependent DNA helicase RecG n=1 Tax=Helicobacter sp. 15-1451 TaxID=2004995 RepID=UPI000DCEB21A|nr:ATP-dependent DNA helicase RecG [Helicobacter sp. 15-1451]RAX56527.1 ATP-dependent DNA helicase RecG [Helicobacter sp. 15-1451]